MLIVCFVKKNAADRGPLRLIVWARGSENLESLKNFVQERNLLPTNVAYGVYRADHLEKALKSIPGSPPAQASFMFEYDVEDIPPRSFAKTPVLGGDPSLPPLGIKGQDRPTGPRDYSGFQELGDQALGVDFDPMFGPNGDGTVSDLLGGLSGTEVPRKE
jgi:hypothetical protein